MTQQLAPQKTKKAFLWNALCGSPLFDLLSQLDLILIQELGVAGFQLGVFFALKPGCSLLSPYWSAIIHRRQDLVKMNLVLANLLRYLPFLFFPFYQNTWLLIGSLAVYWIMEKGMKPAWMEFFRATLPEGMREKVCSLGLKINYCSNIAFPLVFIHILAKQWMSWQGLFSLTALVGMSSTLFMLVLPGLALTKNKQKKPSLGRLMVRPLRDVVQLLRTDPFFLRFQLAFFLGGAGLILVYPAVRAFLAVDLQLTYVEIMRASMVGKGIGFIVASPIWVKQFSRFSLLKLSRAIMALTLCFPCLLAFGHLDLLFIYGAYFLYGVMQAGSGLVWNLSGPSYAKDRPSSVYTTANLLAVGVRGAFFPFVGTYLMGQVGYVATFFIGGGVILAGIVLVTSFIRLEAREALQWKKLASR